MKEITFINTNKKKWNTFEDEVSGKLAKVNPDELADSFIQLTDDLSYARTFFPESNIVPYLNSLTSKAHSLIYRNKKEKSSRLKHFFTTELPLAVYAAQKEFLWSLTIFLISATIGAVSAYADADFLRVILGDDYVNMTQNNIERGDPMGVYGNMDEGVMFLYITMNNICVSFIVFIFGMLTPLGTGLHLFRNGIMVGSFLAFFAQKSLLTVSTLAIMLHGAIELSSIVLAGGAGFILGRSMLFPGTYPRKTALVAGVKRGTKIMIGLAPFFVIAGFIESFVTRHYNTMSMFTSLAIITVSLALIIGYFVIYPQIINSKTTNN
ncbi:MAG: stage II sporulation protein M [Cytophagaceae bacterium]|nr:stage II sporulation protein M [Cytophagaceae bacterium]